MMMPRIDPIENERNSKDAEVDESGALSRSVL